METWMDWFTNDVTVYSFVSPIAWRLGVPVVGLLPHVNNYFGRHDQAVFVSFETPHANSCAK